MIIHDLSSFSIELTKPKSIVLAHNNEIYTVELHAVLRALSNRRLVCKARYNNEWIVIKFYMGEKGSAEFEQELAMHKRLIESNILTADLLFYGLNLDDELKFIAFSYIEALSFEGLWNQYIDKKMCLPTIKKIAYLVGQHHQANLVQVDLHLDNFLFKNDLIFTIDAGGFESFLPTDSGASKKTVDNFALFLAQFPAYCDVWLSACVDSYMQGRALTSLDQSWLWKRCQWHRAHRLKKYLQKTQRTCSEFVRVQSYDRLLIRRRECGGDAWQHLFEHLDQVMSTGEVLKAGRSSHVVRVDVNARTIIIKRYQMKGFWHALTRAFRPSRAWHAWRNGYVLRFIGVNTPLPLAMIEQRHGFLRGTAYLITDALSGCGLVDYHSRGYGLEPLLEPLRQLFERLACYQISHGDMKATNLMVETRLDAQPQLVVIDLDAMKQHHSRASFQSAFAKDQARFLRNWVDFPDILALFQRTLSIFNRGG